MKRIICVVGARPQFIKHFPLEIELSKKFELSTIHTGQHYDKNMSEVFFEQLGISTPTHHLQLTKSSHGGQTAEMLEKIEEILLLNPCNALLVYGDTNSTIAGALAAAKLNIPVVHVEAGLRSRNMNMPEEINRITTDHISSILFCSSEIGANNLKAEGVTKNVFVCGDLMKDALFKLRSKLSKPVDEDFTLATFHRPYNTDNFQRIKMILSALNKTGLRNFFPVHPRTRKILDSHNFRFSDYPNITFIDPLGYIEMLTYQIHSKQIITDSGGIQKEAYWNRVPCTTVRSETEWTETLAGGWNRLVFDDVNELSNQTDPDQAMYDPNLYGDGNAARKITDILLSIL